MNNKIHAIITVYGTGCDVLKPVLLLLFLFTAVFGTEVCATWELEVFGGSAVSFDTNLTIRDSSGREVELNAKYQTKPFDDAPYYAWRVSHQGAVHGWGVELIHHKIYLKNVTTEIQQFEVSHGYNLLMLDYARSIGSFWLHIGGGAVIAYPHANINGELTLGGYQLAGPAGQLAIGKRFHLNRRFFFAVEGKFTIARAVIDLGTHEAHAPNVGFHGLAGIGIRLH